MLKGSKQLGCVSQDTEPPKKSILQIGIKMHRQILHTRHHFKKFGKEKGPSHGLIQKCDPQERNPCATKFEDRTQQETLQRERCARRGAWNLAKTVSKLKARDKRPRSTRLPKLGECRRERRGGHSGPFGTSATTDRRANCRCTSISGRDRRGGEVRPTRTRTATDRRTNCGSTSLTNYATCGTADESHPESVCRRQSCL